MLHKAGLLNSYNCSQVLLHRGADPFSTIDPSEWTPIHLGSDSIEFFILCKYNQFNEKIFVQDLTCNPLFEFKFRGVLVKIHDQVRKQNTQR